MLIKKEWFSKEMSSVKIIKVISCFQLFEVNVDENYFLGGKYETEKYKREMYETDKYKMMKVQMKTRSNGCVYYPISDYS